MLHRQRLKTLPNQFRLFVALKRRLCALGDDLGNRVTNMGKKSSQVSTNGQQNDYVFVRVYTALHHETTYIRQLFNIKMANDQFNLWHKKTGGMQFLSSDTRLNIRAGTGLQTPEPGVEGQPPIPRLIM